MARLTALEAVVAGCAIASAAAALWGSSGSRGCQSLGLAVRARCGVPVAPRIIFILLPACRGIISVCMGPNAQRVVPRLYRHVKASHDLAHSNAAWIRVAHDLQPVKATHAAERNIRLPFGEKVAERNASQVKREPLALVNLGERRASASNQHTARLSSRALPYRESPRKLESARHIVSVTSKASNNANGRALSGVWMREQRPMPGTSCSKSSGKMMRSAGVKSARAQR